MQNWVDLYKELGGKASTIQGIRWVDLWNNQVNFLSEELPFPAPALFFSFRVTAVKDVGQRVQEVKLQVDTFLFYETFADTYHGSLNQGSALEFLLILNDVYAMFHGSSGANYSSMRRIGLNAVDSGGAGNLYQISFECTLIDYAAQKVYDETGVAGISVENGTGPLSEPDASNDYVID